MLLSRTFQHRATLRKSADLKATWRKYTTSKIGVHQGSKSVPFSGLPLRMDHNCGCKNKSLFDGRINASFSQGKLYLASGREELVEKGMKRKDGAKISLNPFGSIMGTSEVVNKINIDPNEWETVYRFAFVRLARVIQRLKIYQTAFTCCLALPGSLGLYLSGALPTEHIGFMLSSSTLACLMLIIMGRFCSRLIGVIYVSKKDPSLVRVAHLNFWGIREDKLFTKTDFIPFSELPDNVADIYVEVKFYSDSDFKLYICLRYGKVYDKVEFEELFGLAAGMEITKIRDKNKTKN